MTFTYTYRDRTGAKREGRIAAASRDAAFAALKSRGISPLSIREGNGRAACPHAAENGDADNDRAGAPRPPQSRVDGTRIDAAVSSKPPHRARRRLSAVLGLLALLAILGGGAAWWLVNGRGNDAPPEEKPPRRGSMPKEARPEIPGRTSPGAKAPPPRRAPQSREEQLAWFRKKYGDDIPENLKTTVYFLEHPPTQVYKPLPRPEDVFKHQSEKTIAAVLLMKPGTFVMRRTVYDESFDVDFRRAMEDPTAIEDGDSDEDRELKKAVNEVKAEWAEQMRAGKNPSELMNEAMDAAYELGKYRREIEAMLRETVDDPSMSDKDVEDFVKAANTMLKEKGLDEIAAPNLLRRQARLRILARKAKERQEQSERKETEK